MNKMKQLIFVLIGFIIAGLVIGIMLNFTKNDLVNQVSESNERTSSAAVKEKEEKDNTLVFLCLYSEPGDSQLFSGISPSGPTGIVSISLSSFAILYCSFCRFASASSFILFFLRISSP